MHLAQGNRVRPSSGVSSWKNLNNPISKNKKYEILVSCDNLPKLDTFTSSDAVCVLFIRRFGKWTEYQRTECIVNCTKPKFTESFILDISELEDQNLRFLIYNMENMTSKDLHQHQEIGFIEVPISSLLEREKPFMSELGGGFKNTGTITIIAEKVNEQNLKDTVNLCIAAQKLSSKKLFGRCTYFMEISRMTSVGTYQPIYRSEIVSKNGEPRWRPFQVSLQKACNGDRSCDITISVWNYRNKGDHELIGECHTTLDSLLQCVGQVKLLPISKPEREGRFSATKRSTQTSPCAVRILQCHVNEQYGLFDYVKGGCNINVIGAMDFSLSNGYPLEDDSLHFLKEDKGNVYIDALYEVGSLLAYYQFNQSFPLFGFGACLTENKDSKMDTKFDQEHFWIGDTNDSKLPKEKAILHLVESYKKVLPKITPKGPTYFTPILRQITKDLKEIKGDDVTYTYGLILTDGICNDEKEFIDELVELRDLPFSVIIVNVSLLDSVSLQVVADKVKKQSGRTMLYSISFLQPDTGLYDSRMIRWTYAQLSKDTVQYFKGRSIKPGTSETFSKKFPSWMERGMTSIEPFIEEINANNINSFIDKTAFCPSCGKLGSANLC